MPTFSRTNPTTSSLSYSATDIQPKTCNNENALCCSGPKKCSGLWWRTVSWAALSFDSSVLKQFGSRLVTNNLILQLNSTQKYVFSEEIGNEQHRGGNNMEGTSCSQTFSIKVKQFTKICLWKHFRHAADDFFFYFCCSLTTFIIKCGHKLPHQNSKASNPKSFSV